MDAMNGPFEVICSDETIDDFALLSQSPTRLTQPLPQSLAYAATGVLHGFGLDERPLVSGLPQFPGELIAARSTVALTQRMIGSGVLVLFEQGDPARPIITGVLQEHRVSPPAITPQLPLSVQSDEQRVVISAEKEVVLRCGDASITLTRAGKVIIKGNYILSRSTGYNKIKGAAIDIN